MRPFYQLGDDGNSNNHMVNFRTILACAAFMLMVLIPVGYFYFQWFK